MAIGKSNVVRRDTKTNKAIYPGSSGSSSKSTQATQSQVYKTSSGSYDTPRGTSGRIDTRTGRLLAPRRSTESIEESPVEAELAPETDVQLDPQLDPNTQAPRGLINQVNQAESQVSSLANQRGLSLQRTPQGGYTTVPDLNARAQQTHQTLQQSGLPVPQTQGAASTQIMGASQNPPAEGPSINGFKQETDPAYDSLFTMLDEYMSTDNQKRSLVDEYKKMSKSFGIEDLNEEIIDAKRIIEGTEDDIRAEITAVGGFGTESQVQALANARNKSLLKNYQVLVDTRDNAMQQLNTMMDLSVQDRQFAEAEFDRKIGFAFKVAEFKERAVSNSRSALNSYISNMSSITGNGYAALYAATGGSLYEQNLIEKTLGLPAGGLQEAALVQPEVDNDFGFMNVDGTIYRTDPKTGAVTPVGGGTDGAGGVSTGKSEKVQEVLTLAKGLRTEDATGKSSAVGASLAKLVPFGKSLGLQGKRAAFENKVDTLRANLTLDNLKLLKGAMSDKDLLFLNAIGSSLSFDMSEKEFDTELDKIINKLENAEPTNSVGGVPITAPDGTQVIITDF